MASCRPLRIYESGNTDGRWRSKSGSPPEPSDTEDFLQPNLSQLQVRCRFYVKYACLPLLRFLSSPITEISFCCEQKLFNDMVG